MSVGLPGNSKPRSCAVSVAHYLNCSLVNFKRRFSTLLRCKLTLMYSMICNRYGVYSQHYSSGNLSNLYISYVYLYAYWTDALSICASHPLYYYTEALDHNCKILEQSVYQHTHGDSISSCDSKTPYSPDIIISCL